MKPCTKCAGEKGDKEVVEVGSVRLEGDDDAGGGVAGCAGDGAGCGLECKASSCSSRAQRVQKDEALLLGVS